MSMTAGKYPRISAFLRRVSLPDTVSRRIRRWGHPARLGVLHRTSPFSEVHGFDRGTPVDRYYIERFLDQHREDIHGRVLEMQGSGYTRRYGHDVVEAAVLDIDPTNPVATIIADLTAANTLLTNQFDCFVLTQTLHLIYDVPAALAHAWRILRPGGVLLATVPAVGRVANSGDGTTYWRFTSASCQKLFGAAFGDEHVAVEDYGNVLACVAHLMGMAYEEFRRRELDIADARFPLVIAVRAVKSTLPAINPVPHSR
jgi:SAM-dependent methyltransferase